MRILTHEEVKITWLRPILLATWEDKRSEGSQVKPA
jgi:hypothetical protein